MSGRACSLRDHITSPRPRIWDTQNHRKELTAYAGPVGHEVGNVKIKLRIWVPRLRGLGPVAAYRAASCFVAPSPWGWGAGQARWVSFLSPAPSPDGRPCPGDLSLVAHLLFLLYDLDSGVVVMASAPGQVRVAVPDRALPSALSMDATDVGIFITKRTFCHVCACYIYLFTPSAHIAVVYDHYL